MWSTGSLNGPSKTPPTTKTGLTRCPQNQGKINIFPCATYEEDAKFRGSGREVSMVEIDETVWKKIMVLQWLVGCMRSRPRNVEGRGRYMSGFGSAPHIEHCKAGTLRTTTMPNSKSAVKVVVPGFWCHHRVGIEMVGDFVSTVSPCLKVGIEML
jgi:hypothetical protein